MTILENILLTYNIILTVLLTVCATGFCLFYKKNVKSGFLYLSILYLLLILDNIPIYISEFSLSFEKLYITSSIPYLITGVIYLGILLITRMILASLCERPVTRREKTLWALLMLIVGCIYAFTPYEIGEVTLYYSFYMAFSYMAYCFYRYLKIHKDNLGNSSLSRYRRVLMLMILLNLVSMIDIGVYYMTYADYTFIETAPITIDYRSLAFDMVKLLICYVGIRYLYHAFDQQFEKKASQPKNREEKLRDFCTHYSLTSRQQEIIALILEGHTNKAISEQLHITEGTVKTHIYNIFRKTEISSRNQLMNLIHNNTD